MSAALGLLCVLAAPLADPAAEARAMALGDELRCPVCQGMPIAESPADMAQSMMGRVRELVAEGKSDAEVKGYFVERYGEWVLLSPVAEGFNLTVWLLPGLAFVVALALVGLYVARHKKQAAAGAATPPPSAASPAADDPYVKAVRQRLEDGDF